MKLTALSVSVWDADDYLHDRNTDPLAIDRYLFESEEEAKAFALTLDYDSEIYNEGWIYEADIDDEEILALTLFDTIGEFLQGMRGNLHEEEIAQWVVEQDGCGTPCDCANYDFDRSLGGAILVVWSWQTYVGYARKCMEIRYAYPNETAALLTKQDRTYVSQVDVAMTAEEVAASKDIKADLEGALLGNCDCWKWTNPQHVEFLISHL